MNSLDLEFIREIILKIRSWSSYEPMSNYDLIDENTSISKVNFYLDLLMDEQLICANKATYINGQKNYRIMYLTFKGESLCNLISNEYFWKRCKKEILSKGLSFFGDIVMKIILSKL